MKKRYDDRSLKLHGSGFKGIPYSMFDTSSSTIATDERDETASIAVLYDFSLFFYSCFFFLSKGVQQKNRSSTIA